jgi:hypothetical protein
MYVAKFNLPLQWVALGGCRDKSVPAVNMGFAHIYV